MIVLNINITDVVNVHLVPHSHDDVGWLKTMDEYYTGEHSDIFNANVSRIITEVVKSLQKDKHRRYKEVSLTYL